MPPFMSFIAKPFFYLASLPTNNPLIGSDKDFVWKSTLEMKAIISRYFATTPLRARLQKCKTSNCNKIHSVRNYLCYKKTTFNDEFLHRSSNPKKKP